MKNEEINDNISSEEDKRSKKKTDDMKKELLEHPPKAESSEDTYEGSLRSKKGKDR